MIVRSNEYQDDVKSQLRGGNGDSLFKIIHPSNDYKNVKQMSSITLKTGCSIGFHEHRNETEYYYILEGKGVVKEEDGEKIVEKGDTVITSDKQSHSIENTSEEDLVFLAIIITF